MRRTIPVVLLALFCALAYGDMDTELKARSEQEGWTFKFKAPKKKYATGLIKDLNRMQSEEPSDDFERLDEKFAGKFSLTSMAPLPPIFDQGNCGSCVYNSVVMNLEYHFKLRGKELPRLSRQFLMDCAAPWSCGGSFFSKVADGLLAKGGTPTEANYKYVARNQSCKGIPSELLGKIEKAPIIRNSAKSIIGALNKLYPVSVTVGADNSFMSYQSGVYNACRNTATNHEVLIIGYDCESSVDADGKCVFDANGKLPPGVGTWTVVNSWGLWGDHGLIVMKMTNSQGRLCNNVAEEAGILESGINPTPTPTPTPTPIPPPPPPPPPTPSEAGMPLWMWLALGTLLAGGFVLMYLKAKKDENL